MKYLESQLRLGSGLILAAYVTQHLINHSFGIVSIEAAELYRATIGEVFQSIPGLVLLYGSLLFHLIIALRSIYRRASLRMPAWQWLQLLLGLSILPLLLGHMIGNRGYDLLGNVDPDYFFVVTSLLQKPVVLAKLVLLILVVWLHMVVGLHFWLRVKPGYPKLVPLAYALVILIPALAYAGIFNMLQQASTWQFDAERLAEIFAPVKAMDKGDLRLLAGLENKILLLLGLALLAVLVARQLRLWKQHHRSSHNVTSSSGASTRSPNGVSLLEALRNANIPHASVCGGRARCTTCRVRIGKGLDSLPAPNDLEARALARIGAASDIRLACQLYPQADLSITPLVLAGLTLDKLHTGGVQGHEEYVIAMFVDMRGSTSLGERILAYDVVFILNRFFTELSEALSDSHGHYAQFAGDGLMALYGLDAQRKSCACSDALNGAREMFRRIDKLNQQLLEEFGESVKMGIGIHGGDAIVGTMGPPKTPLLTAVGDHINIAARLEGQTKTLGCDLLVSAQTLEKEGIGFAPELAIEVDIRGRDKPVLACAFSREQIPKVEQ